MICWGLRVSGRGWLGSEWSGVEFACYAIVSGCSYWPFIVLPYYSSFSIIIDGI